MGWQIGIIARLLRLHVVFCAVTDECVTALQRMKFVYSLFAKAAFALGLMARNANSRLLNKWPFSPIRMVLA
jgi:hypothetical protein